MSIRWGPGPVFYYEWLALSRRWQMYAVRSLFVAFLLIAIALVWFSGSSSGLVSRRALASMGADIFYAVVGTQLALVLLGTPAVTAGAVCLDKARGSLLQLLVTDLSNVEIILGKLAARLIPVLGMVFCSLPVLSLAVFMGGIDPDAVLGAFLVILACSIFSSVLALTLSVWGRKTHEVVLATYLVLGVVLLCWPMASAIGSIFRYRDLIEVSEISNPFWLAFAPYNNPGRTDLMDSVVFLCVALGLSVLLLALAIWRVRRVVVAQASKGQRSARRPGILRRLRHDVARSTLFLLDLNPLLWRETCFNRSSRWGLVVWLMYFLGCGLFTLLIFAMWFTGGSRSEQLPLYVIAFEVSIGLLLYSVSAVTSLAEERSRQTLEVLLTAPISSRAIIMGKWLATYRTWMMLMIFPAVVAFLSGFGSRRHWDELSLACPFLIVGLCLSYGAFVTSLGLALATWCNRLVKALACMVTLVVLVTAAWPMGIIGLGMNNEAGAQLAIASPFFGPALMLEDQYHGDKRIIGGALWFLAYAGLAVVFLFLTFWTFDRCLGRMPERSRYRRRVRLSTQPYAHHRHDHQDNDAHQDG